MADEPQPIASPCVSICALDENDICVGCFRTGGEISIWGLLSHAEKQEVMRRIPLRMDGEPAPCVVRKR
ncbi:hypothetical protein A11A3_02182 [Alcanivorax hongdengensis A-11-3]|uniref:Fe-S protein n=2 Tax=Alcanivorax hongdengensis TaxID=519051 RepID=L0WFZ5_9GAMM|nr:DUF1289 domain-containing protein [Alcanivorax hongdengensis]EKF75639.1 hypothetical protein A11A3_02182 [Alcanivorax hongdengensis A-11-3]